MNQRTRTITRIVAIISFASAVISIQPSAYAYQPSAGSPPASFIVGITPGATGEAAEIIIDGISDLALAAKKGTPITVYDALKSREIVTFITPPSGSERIRKRKIKGSIKKITEYLDRAQSVRIADGHQVHLPSFLDSISSSVRAGGGGTRIVIFGSLFFSDDREQDASFTEGFVPSDGHVLCSSYQSIYGTADKKDALAGVIVDICTLGYEAGSLEQRSVERFWSVFLSEQNGLLASVEAYPDVIIDRAVTGATDPVTQSKINRHDTALEIRPVRKLVPTPVPDPTPPHQPDPVEAHGSSSTHSSHKPVPEPEIVIVPLNPTFSSVDCVMAWDGSYSMRRVLPMLGESATSIASMGSRMTMGYSFGAVVYRLKTTTSIFELSLFERSSNDQPSEGMQAWKWFTDVAKLGLYDRDGKSQTINHIDGVNTLVDVEFGIYQSLRMLKNGSGQRKVLVIAGDRGHVELDGELDGFSEEDKKACQRIENMVRDFADNQNDFRIVALFTGDPNGDEVERESSAFFKRLAAIAGDRGVYTESVFGLESVVSRAILDD